MISSVSPKIDNLLVISSGQLRARGPGHFVELPGLRCTELPGVHPLGSKGDRWGDALELDARSELGPGDAQRNQGKTMGKRHEITIRSDEINRYSKHRYYTQTFINSGGEVRVGSQLVNQEPHVGK